MPMMRRLLPDLQPLLQLPLLPLLSLRHHHHHRQHQHPLLHLHMGKRTRYRLAVLIDSTWFPCFSFCQFCVLLSRFLEFLNVVVSLSPPVRIVASPCLLSFSLFVDSSLPTDTFVSFSSFVKVRCCVFRASMPLAPRLRLKSCTTNPVHSTSWLS